MFTPFGTFLGKGEKFAVNKQELPRNWYNYFYTDNYITFTSQVGIGQGFLQDRLGRRLMPVTERGVYALTENGGYNLAYCKKAEKYRCVHETGCTKIFMSKDGINTEYGLFVSDEMNELSGYEVAFVKVKNTTCKEQEIKIIAYCGNNFDGAYVYQGYNTDALYCDKEFNGIHRSVFSAWNDNENQQFEFFIAPNIPLNGYDCAKNAFISPYGSVLAPRALSTGCTNSDCVAEKCGYAVQVKLTLKSGEKGFVSFVMGLSENLEEAHTILKRFDSESKVDNELKAVLKKHQAINNDFFVCTPDENLNYLMNNWLPYQTDMGSRWARVRHNGYRDIASDTECLAAFNAPLAWKRIKRLLTYQYSNGYAPRTFIDGKICDNSFSDCTVWLTFTVYYILNEIGDINILSETVAFNDGSEASVYEHIRRSVDFLYHFRGLHGLIKIWGGDWNDCMNTAGIKGKGVSVWLSIAWFRACRLFVEIAEKIGNNKDALLFSERAAEIRELVDKYGWDEKGGYYIYAYNDDDEKIGSSDCNEGQIFLNPQLWAVMSGVGFDEKAKTAFLNAEKELDCELGTRISTPAYTAFNPGIGNMTQKAPGVQENGGVYLHSMCWKLAASAMLGYEDMVERDMNRILPFNNKIVNGRCEPYTLCNCYMGSETGYRYGTAGQSWRTASGQWFLKAMINYVFGVMPTFGGLMIKPCLPKSWNTARITKSFRGSIYNIVFVRTGKFKLIVDGEKTEGNVITKKAAAVDVICEF